MDSVLHSLVSAGAELLWPTRCVGCERPGTLLCDECLRSFPWIEQRWACPSCGAPDGYLVCTECAHDWGLDALVCAASYEGVAKRLVTVLKDEHETRLAPIVAAAMSTALDEAAAWDAHDGSPRFSEEDVDAIAFVPATARAYARRGFDHMALVAEALSQLTGIPVADVLVRGPALDQRHLGRDERAENLEGSVRVLDDVSDMRILLVDDVVTTGASMRACAAALRARGAARVVGCALCRVW